MAEERNQYDSNQRGGSRYFAKPKFCQFCADKSLTVDYKKTDLLRKFITEEGNIRPRRQTGTCAKHQRVVASAVKQARQIALLPFTGKQVEEMR